MDLDEVVAISRSIARDVAGPLAAETDAQARWPATALRALQDAGLGGLVVPVGLGGLGRGMLGLARSCEELAQGCASTAMCFGMHSVAAAVLAAKCTPAQAERYLEPICSGAHLTTLALSEPGTGVHFYFPQCACEVDAEGSLRLRGKKSFVTNGGHADSYVVSVRRSDEPEARTGSFSCVVVDADRSGMTWGPEWSGLGLRGNSSRELNLDDVQIPGERLLGEEGDQLWYVFQVVAPYFLTAMAGTYLGIAQAAFDACRADVTARRFAHSGRGLSSSPVVQHKLGCLWATLERSRRLLYHAAANADRGDEGSLLSILSIKAEISDCASHVASEAMTLMGGRVYREGSAMHRHLRDARAAHVMSPTTDLLRQWVGRALLNLPLLGD